MRKYRMTVDFPDELQRRLLLLKRQMETQLHRRVTLNGLVVALVARGVDEALKNEKK